MEGRKCAICCKPGGHPLTMVLKAIGVPGNYAHSDCVAKLRKELAKAKKGSLK